MKSKNELWKTLLNHCRSVLWFLRQTARQRLRGRLLQPRYRCELAPGRCLLDLFVLFGPVGLDHGLVFGWINYRKSCLWSPTPSWGIWNFPSFRQEIHSAFYSKTITKEFLITSWWNSLTTFYLKCKCYLWNSFLKFWVDVIWYYVLIYQEVCFLLLARSFQGITENLYVFEKVKPTFCNCIVSGWANQIDWFWKVNLYFNIVIDFFTLYFVLKWKFNLN